MSDDNNSFITGILLGLLVGGLLAGVIVGTVVRDGWVEASKTKQPREVRLNGKSEWYIVRKINMRLELEKAEPAKK